MLSVGDRFLDFRVKAVLGGPGTSGEGEVYLLEDTHRRLLVAKTFQEKFGTAWGALQLSKEEANLAAFNNHQNIVQYYGSARLGGQQFMLMEYVDGTILEEHLHKARYDLHDVVDWSVQIADALVYLQQSGCCHTDLSTQNIIVRPDNSIKLVDLAGVALSKYLPVFKSDDPFAPFKGAGQFGLIMLRLYNLSLQCELHGPVDEANGEGEDPPDEGRAGWRHLADQHAEALYRLGGTITYLYSPDMSEERVICKRPLKSVISRLLRSAEEKVSIQFIEIEKALIDVHTAMRRRQQCAAWLNEVELDHPLSAEVSNVEGVLAQLCDRAELRHMQRIPDKARKLLQTASDTAIRKLGTRHAVTQEVRTRLALAYAAGEDYGKAEEILRGVADIDRTTHGARSVEYTISLNNLGAVLHRSGKLDDAKAIFLQSLEIKRDILTPDDSSLGTVFSNLGRLCRDREELVEAECWLQRALENDVKALGRESDRFREDANLLADVYRRSGRTGEAETLLQSAADA